MVNLIVVAKEPRPGRVKTRLCPPCTFEEAAGLAKASLEDTLGAVSATSGARHFLAIHGTTKGLVVPPSVVVLPQRRSGLAERLASAFEDVGAPALLIGMDTPQITPGALLDALALFCSTDGAVLGPARDGGYWAIGLKETSDAVFHGIPMSTERTYSVQRERLLELGWSVAALPPLTDVDDIASAFEVADAAPETSFAQHLAAVAARWAMAVRVDA